MKKLANISAFESLMNSATTMSQNSIFNDASILSQDNIKRLTDLYAGKKGSEDILPFLIKGAEDGSIDFNGVSDYELEHRGDLADMLRSIKRDYDYSIKAAKNPDLPESEYSVPEAYGGIAKHYDQILDELAHGTYGPSEYMDEWDYLNDIGNFYNSMDKANGGSVGAFIDVIRKYQKELADTKEAIRRIEEDIATNGEDKAYAVDNLPLWKIKQKRLEEKINGILETEGAKAYKKQLASVLEQRARSGKDSTASDMLENQDERETLLNDIITRDASVPPSVKDATTYIEYRVAKALDDYDDAWCARDVTGDYQFQSDPKNINVEDLLYSTYDYYIIEFGQENEKTNRVRRELGTKLQSMLEEHANATQDGDNKKLVADIGQEIAKAIRIGLEDGRVQKEFDDDPFEVYGKVE